jgi:hypothetical protein
MSISDLSCAVHDIQIYTYPEDFSQEIANLNYKSLPKGQSILTKKKASRSILFTALAVSRSMNE